MSAETKNDSEAPSGGEGQEGEEEDTFIKEYEQTEFDDFLGKMLDDTNETLEPYIKMFLGPKRHTEYGKFSQNLLKNLPKYDNYSISHAQLRKPVSRLLKGVPVSMDFPVVPQAKVNGHHFVTSPIPRNLDDFVWLRTMLIKEMPGLIIPPLPPRISSIFLLADHIVPSDFEKEAVYKLEVFLQRVIGHPDLCNRLTVKMFCLAPVEIFNKYKSCNEVATAPLNVTRSVGAFMEGAKETFGMDMDKKIATKADDTIEHLREWSANLQEQMKTIETKTHTLLSTRMTLSESTRELDMALRTMALSNKGWTGELEMGMAAQYGTFSAKELELTTQQILVRVADFIVYLDCVLEAFQTRDLHKLEVQALCLFHSASEQSAADAAEAEKELKAAQADADAEEAAAAADPDNAEKKPSFMKKVGVAFMAASQSLYSTPEDIRKSGEEKAQHIKDLHSIQKRLIDEVYDFQAASTGQIQEIFIGFIELEQAFARVRETMLQEMTEHLAGGEAEETIASLDLTELGYPDVEGEAPNPPPPREKRVGATCEVGAKAWDPDDLDGEHWQDTAYFIDTYDVNDDADYQKLLNALRKLYLRGDEGEAITVQQLKVRRPIVVPADDEEEEPAPIEN